MTQIILIYIAAINITAFAAYVVDKWKAVRGRWRISEKVLVLLALAGGSGGAYIGMCIVRHKISKPLFAIGIPLILLVQIGIATYLYVRILF